ncbi:MAG: nucleoside hydrolase [Phascolarctobacterium sp.]|nr:nucleoside hydrolase [Phascolarctobacterium sp.]
MIKKYSALLGAFLTAMSFSLAQPMEIAEAAQESTKIVAPKAPFVYKKDSPSWQAFCQKYKLNPEAKGKRVIMDCDLTYLNDDFFALMEVLKLHQYGFIKLEGISIVGANNIVAACTFETLSTLEALGYRDIPVYMGTDKPLKGFKNPEEIKKNVGKLGYLGTYMHLGNYTKDWKSKAARENAKGIDFLTPSTLEVEDKDATTFMLETVKKYPGEVQIISLGGLMNVANAIKKDTSFAENCAGIMIMGGVFDTPGEMLNKIEINWWYDPAAVNIVSNAKWKKIMILPHDAATYCRKDLNFVDKYAGKYESNIVKLVKRDLPKAQTYMPETALEFFWDPIAVAALVYPEIITKKEVRHFAVQENWGYGYGNTFHWPEGQAPSGVGKGEIILAVDGKKFYDFMTDLHTLED